MLVFIIFSLVQSDKRTGEICLLFLFQEAMLFFDQWTQGIKEFHLFNAEDFAKSFSYNREWDKYNQIAVNV